MAVIEMTEKTPEAKTSEEEMTGAGAHNVEDTDIAQAQPFAIIAQYSGELETQELETWHGSENTPPFVWSSGFTDDVRKAITRITAETVKRNAYLQAMPLRPVVLWYLYEGSTEQANETSNAATPDVVTSDAAASGEVPPGVIGVAMQSIYPQMLEMYVSQQREKELLEAALSFLIDEKIAAFSSMKQIPMQEFHAWLLQGGASVIVGRITPLAHGRYHYETTVYASPILLFVGDVMAKTG